MQIKNRMKRANKSDLTFFLVMFFNVDLPDSYRSDVNEYLRNIHDAKNQLATGTTIAPM